MKKRALPRARLNVCAGAGQKCMSQARCVSGGARLRRSAHFSEGACRSRHKVRASTAPSGIGCTANHTRRADSSARTPVAVLAHVRELYAASSAAAVTGAPAIAYLFPNLFCARILAARAPCCSRASSRIVSARVCSNTGRGAGTRTRIYAAATAAAVTCAPALICMFPESFLSAHLRGSRACRQARVGSGIVSARTQCQLAHRVGSHRVSSCRVSSHVSPVRPLPDCALRQWPLHVYTSRAACHVANITHVSKLRNPHVLK